MFDCPKCGKTLKDRAQYKRHLKKKIPCDQKFGCDRCQEVFSSKRALNAHLKRKSDCLEDELKNRKKLERLLQDYLTLKNFIQELMDDIKALKKMNLLEMQKNMSEMKEDIFCKKIEVKARFGQMIIRNTQYQEKQRKCVTLSKQLESIKKKIEKLYHGKHIVLNQESKDWIYELLKPFPNIVLPHLTGDILEVQEIVEYLYDEDERVIYYQMKEDHTFRLILWGVRDGYPTILGLKAEICQIEESQGKFQKMIDLKLSIKEKERWEEIFCLAIDSVLDKGISIDSTVQETTNNDEKIEVSTSEESHKGEESNFTDTVTDLTDSEVFLETYRNQTATL